jgi:hypothetical protein
MENLKTRLGGFIQSKRVIKEAPEGLTQACVARLTGLIFSLVFILVLLISGFHFFIPMFIFAIVFFLFDFLRFLYYIYFGKWEEIVGEITNVSLHKLESGLRLSKVREAIIESNGSLYSMLLPTRLINIFKENTWISIVVPTSSTIYPRNGVFHIGSVLSRKAIVVRVVSEEEEELDEYMEENDEYMEENDEYMEEYSNSLE